MPVVVNLVGARFEVSVNGKKLIDGHTGKIARFNLCPLPPHLGYCTAAQAELWRVLTFLGATTPSNESSRTPSPDD